MQEQHRRHKGKWLNWEAVEEYRQKVKKLNLNSSEYVGELRKLGKQFQKEYGLLEIEAINILNGYHVADYVNKYYRIKNMIPIDVAVRKGKKSEEEEN